MDWAWHEDEYYRTWPSPITDLDMRQGCFLRNLTPREEFAHFLNERGHCLLDHLRLGEALESYYYANQLMPYDGCIRGAWIVATIKGLEHLTGLSRLKWVHVEQTRVTAAGEDAFWRVLPGCSVQR